MKKITSDKLRVTSDNRDIFKSLNFKLLNFKLLTLLSAFCLLPFGTFAQLTWNGNVTLTSGQVVNENVTLTGNVTVNVASGFATINGVITGSYSLTKTGSGDLFLAGTNTYSGGTTISNGGLSIGANGTTGSITGNVVVQASCYFDFRRTNDYTFPGVISGPGHVWIWNTGKITLTGTNTYTGTTRVNEAGILQIGNGTTGSINNTANVVVTLSGSIIRFEPGEKTYFDKVILGLGKMECKTDVQKWLYLTANNTYEGTTTIEGDEMVLGNNTAAGSVAGNIVLAAGGCLSFWRSNEYTYSGVISGTGVRLYKYGNNKVILTGNNTYYAQTYVSAGTLQIGAGGAGSISNTSGVFLNSENSILRFEPGASMVFEKAISGSGKVEFKGASARRLAFTGNNTFSGTTTIDGGELLIGGALGTPGTTGAIAGNIIINNVGTVEGWLTFNRSNDYTYSGIISGNGIVHKAGGGKTILTGVNTYFGKTYMSGGILQVGNGTSGSINNTANVELDASTATLRFEPGAAMIFSKVISGSGKVEFKGSSNYSKNLIFTADNNYSGTTTVEEGALYIGNNTTTGSVAGNIILSGTETCWLDVRRSNDYTYSGVISGTGNVYKYGTAKLTLNGANTFTGETRIEDGTLVLGTFGTIENSSMLRFEHTTTTPKFDISAGNKTIKNLNSSGSNPEVILGASTLTIGTSATSTDGGGTFGGKITGTGAVTKTGTYILAIRGENNYTGITTISAGLISVGYNSPTGTIAGSIVNNAGLEFDRSNDYTYSGNISGTGYVSQYGIGTLTLTGTLTYTGETRIRYSTLILGASTSIESSSGVVITNNVTKLDISSANKTIKNLYGNIDDQEIILGTRTLTIGTSGQDNGGGQFLGKFTGGGSVLKQGTATFTMGGANTATGGFTVAGGMVKFTDTWAGNFSQLASTTLDIIENANIGGTLTLNGGTINMDITGTTPSKITADGALSATGVTTLNITSEAVTNHAIMQAASGIISTSNFQLYMPGLTASLSATGTHLFLTAVVDDVTPPEPGASGVITGTASAGSVDLSWTEATDDYTPTDQLQYYVYGSMNDDINTVADCEANGTLLNTGVNITGFEVIGLTPNTTYYFNVVVSDRIGNKAAYIMELFTTTGVGIEPITNDELRITVYPNPTSGELRMEVAGQARNDVKIENIEVFDVMGKCHLSLVTCHSSLVTLNISHLSTGIYFVKIQTEQGTVTKKVIKN